MDVSLKPTSTGFIALHGRKLIISTIVFILIIATGILFAPTKAKFITVPKDVSFQKTCSQQILNSTQCSIVRIFTGGHIMAGTYEVPKIIFTPTFAYRLVHGISHEKQIKVTFPEGNTYSEMNTIIDEAFPGMQDGDLEILHTAQNRTGYYFPTTYFFSENITYSQILTRMNEQAKIVHTDLINKHQNSIVWQYKNHTWNDIVVMASILEKEATKQDAHMIAGILWKRLEKGWPLQVDAAPITYEQKGLPNYSISNPGEFMLKAALEPTASDYWYYLHDKTGQVHYAKTLDEQTANVRKYLK